MKKWLVILSLIAIVIVWKFVLSPTKLEFTDRFKVFNGLNFAVQYKDKVAEYWRENNALPTRDQWDETPHTIEVDFQNSLVESIEVGVAGPGVISITYTNTRDNSVSSVINDKKLYLTPEIRGDEVVWSCKGDLPADFLPKPCR